jgi:hypothetical protein
MLEVISLSLQIAAGIALPVWVIRRDMRRLSPERLARAWNDATVWSAVAAFGPLALIVHFARTRRSFAGLGLGLGWAIASLAIGVALGWLGSG